jgi:xanthine dehydrogenase YagS FAD-binding subunit
MTPNFSYVRVTSVKDAVQQLAEKRSRVLAGGTDLLGCLREHILDADKVVSIGRVADLHGIKEMPDGGLRVGALTTITELAESPAVAQRYPALGQAAIAVGSPQLRNQGTLGGNLCQKPRCWYYRGEFPCLRRGGPLCSAMEGENQYHAIFGTDRICAFVHPSDTAPALIAYQANVRVVGPKGTRLVPIEKFYLLPRVDVLKETVLAPGEIVTEVIIPKPPAAARGTYRKVRARQSWDFALAGAAIVTAFQDGKVAHARVVFSGVAPVPWSSREVEAAIIGKKLDAEVIATAAEAAVRRADPLEHNEYKVPLVKAVVEEELTKIAKG